MSAIGHRIFSRAAAQHPASAPENVAAVYDRAGDDYLAYADGDPARLFDFNGTHGYADRRIWSVLDERLTALRASGARAVTLLDAGCGPGTWMRRLVTRARELGFAQITARGFDVARKQVRRARFLARDLYVLPGVDLTFEAGDLTTRLPEADSSVDITLCLYSVLSHLPVGSLPTVAAEIARVTSGFFVASVRSIGSTPTAFVDSLERVLEFQHDHIENRCRIEFRDGGRTAFDVHLFAATELQSHFAERFDIEQLRGLDLFHSRFAPDPRWNPACVRLDAKLITELVRLEETYATNPDFMDRATHLLLVARGKQATKPTTPSTS